MSSSGPSFSENMITGTKRLSLSPEDAKHEINRFRSSDPAQTLVETHLISSQTSGNSRRRPRRESATGKCESRKEKLHKRKSKFLTEELALDFVVNNDQDLTMNELRNFVLRICQSKSSSYTPLFSLSAPWNVKKTIFAFVPGLLESDFDYLATSPDGKQTQNLRFLDPHSSNTGLPFLHQQFKCMIPTKLPANNNNIVPPIPALLQFPLTKAARKRRAQEVKDIKITLHDLVLSEDQMLAGGYPTYTIGKQPGDSSLPEGWVKTKAFEHEGSHTFALDCEFCEAKSGKVLTRISIINFQDEVVYDQLVKPEDEIVDYLTRYSGVTEDMLRGTTTTLDDVQKKVLSIVSATDILIGHSLHSDLSVMKLVHPRIIDTALLFEHHRGPSFKYSLKHLAETHLGRSIQSGEQNRTGHSSVEDSRACLDLVKLKLIEGPDFGKILGCSLFHCISQVKKDYESIIVDYSIHDYGSILSDTDENNLRTHYVTDDDEVTDIAIREMNSNLFSLLWFRELEFMTGMKSLPNGYRGRLQIKGDESDGTEKEKREYILRGLNGRLERLYDSMPNDSLLIICSGGGDTSDIDRLQRVKWNFQKNTRAGVDVTTMKTEDLWNFDMATQLHKATELSRVGLSFITLKT